MEFKTGRQFGLGNRKYKLTADFTFFGQELPKELIVDGSSVPKVPIMFGATALLLLDFYWVPPILEKLIILTMLLVGICESSGWFMKPAAVHDYRFQNANNLFGWVEANMEYFVLMLKKISEYVKTNPNKDSVLKIIFHSLMGLAISVAHFIMLMLFGWLVWYGYYFKNKTKT